jgi:shikimate kinase
VPGPRNLVLVGFMGSGKTAVGRPVAARLGLAFVDLDEVIVAEAGRSIAEIFRDSGEPEFRRLERQAVARAAGRAGQVLAPGGGAVMDDPSWRLLRDGNVVVHLRATPRALLRRIRHSEQSPEASGARPRDTRPLAQVAPAARRWPGAARRRLTDLMGQREARYAEAPHTVDTTGRSVAETVRAVEGLARSAGLGAAGA